MTLLDGCGVKNNFIINDFYANLILNKKYISLIKNNCLHLILRKLKNAQTVLNGMEWNVR